MENKFDVIVIGAGPAGMMAAGRAAEKGASVLLLEKNRELGRKLLITGKGRCNITQAEFNDTELVKKFGKRGKFLYSAFSKFGPKDVIEFFEKRGLKTKIERGNRVFPKSDQAMDVLKTLKSYLDEKSVVIRTGQKVSDIKVKGNKILEIEIQEGKFSAKNYIFAVGGKVVPETGSTGDGYAWSESLGHKINNPSPALVPIKIKEAWPKELQGLGLKNVEVHAIQNGKKQLPRFGEMIFTHFGVSGPIILDMSKEVGKLLSNEEIKLSIDLKPALDEKKLDERIQRDFSKVLNKQFKNALDELLPQKMIPVIIKLSGIDPEKPVNVVTKEERKSLVKLLKNLEMTVESLMGFDHAIVTTGGVEISEIDSSTMKSKIVDNLFFAGEIIDLDGPTGGYNLQLCWSTGFLAGENAGK
jgi:predicted Rossmann fold flavoprotein